MTDDLESRTRTLLAGDLSLAEVAEQLGHPTYAAFGSWCRRHFGASPRELREGAPRQGRPTSVETASVAYQIRCTPDEREAIAAALAEVASRLGLPYGAALLRVLSDVARRPAKQCSSK